MSKKTSLKRGTFAVDAVPGGSTVIAVSVQMSTASFFLVCWNHCCCTCYNYVIKQINTAAWHNDCLMYVAFDCTVHRIKKGLGNYVRWMAVLSKLDGKDIVVSTGLFFAQGARWDVVGKQKGLLGVCVTHASTHASRLIMST